MGDLDELLERTTIGFPHPLKSDKIKSDFFPYLCRKLPINLRWSFSGFGHLGMAMEGEEYLDKINLNISQQKAPFAFASFEFQRQRGNEVGYFDSIRLATYACDSLEEVMSMPSGEGQLELTDQIRITVNSYFSQGQDNL